MHPWLVTASGDDLTGQQAHSAKAYPRRQQRRKRKQMSMPYLPSEHVDPFVKVWLSQVILSQPGKICQGWFEFSWGRQDLVGVYHLSPASNKLKGHLLFIGDHQHGSPILVKSHQRIGRHRAEIVDCSTP